MHWNKCISYCPILENTLRKLILLVILVGLSGAILSAHAQESFDIGFAVSGLTAPSNNTSGSLLFPTPSIGGGTYLGFNGDYLFKKNFGVGGEINWRAHQNIYNGFQPYRPLFWDFNAIYAPKLGPRVTAELLAGIGVESVRFYNNFYTCSYITGCTNYTSSNHFMGDFGGGLRLYVKGGLFLRPEARFYLVHNNVEFNSNHSTRYGVTLGYSFGGR